MKIKKLGKRSTAMEDGELLCFFDETGALVAEISVVSRIPYNRLCEKWRAGSLSLPDLQALLAAIRTG